VISNQLVRLLITSPLPKYYRLSVISTEQILY